MSDFESVKRSVSLKEYAEAVLGHAHGGVVCPSCGSGTGPKGTPALSVKGDRWKCFACDAGGDVFDLAGLVEGKESKREQLEAVAGWAGIPLQDRQTPREALKPQGRKPVRKEPERAAESAREAHTAGRASAAEYVRECQSRISDRDAVAYLASRGLDLDTARAFGLGWDPDRYNPARRARSSFLVVPWEGSQWYYTARDTSGDGAGKYLKPKADEVGPQPLYNPKALEAGHFFVVEGALDAVAVRACGHEAVAMGGTAARSVADAVSAAGYGGCAIVLADDDEPGARAAAELVGALSDAGVHATSATLRSLKAKDAAEAYAEDREALAVALDSIAADAARAKDEADYLADLERYSDAMRGLRVLDTASVLDGLVSLEGATDPVPTGLPSLDAVLGGGLQRGLYVLGATSSLGKTTLMVQIADRIAASGHPVLFVTIEQSAQEIVAKSIARIMRSYGSSSYMPTSGELTNRRKRAGWTSGTLETFLRAVEEYRGTVAPWLRVIEGMSQPTAAQIAQAAGEMLRFVGVPPVVVVDYLQLIAPSERGMSDKQAADENVTALRQLANSINAPVVVISSLNRSSYSGVIELDSFKESGGIEYGADVLLGLQPYHMEERIEEASRAKRGGTDYDRKRAAKEVISECKRSAVRECEVVVLKNRSGSIPQSPIHVTFDAAACTFEDAGEAERSGERRQARTVL